MLSPIRVLPQSRTTTYPPAIEHLMEKQSGDKYLRDIAAFIRANERGLAESGLVRKKPPPPEPSLFPWASQKPFQKPMVLSIDTHHLFYILIRLQALAFEIGTLDVRIESPSRPMSYVNIYPEQKDADTLSLASLRSSLSVVSSLSLGGGWWSSADPPSADADLKYIYSSFTKLPSLAICAPGRKVITELLNDSPNQNAVPLDVFKNLQRLECENIDPRSLLGWDRLAESLRSLKIKRSGLEEISEVIIGAVLDDQARRQGISNRQHLRNTNHNSMPPLCSSLSGLPEVNQVNDYSVHSDNGKPSPSLPENLSELKWAFLKHLYLPDNSLTSFPSDVLPHLTSLTHLDLSSNLLVSVPSGLGELYNLRSLNLADNLIDSVLGIYLNLGQILSLNLSHNRLESLCGLERLLALERIDLRHNLIEESSEIGRLTPLPNLSALLVEGNPLVEIEEEYRTTCFDYFWREGKLITLDGTQPGLYEKRSLTFQIPSNLVHSTSSTPIIPIENPRGSSQPFLPRDDILSFPPPPQQQQQQRQSQSRSFHSPPVLSLAKDRAGHRRKKLKRIVDLDENQSDYSIEPQSHPHSRIGSADVLTDREMKPILDTQSVTTEDPQNTHPGAQKPLHSHIVSSQRPHHARHQSDFVHSFSPSEGPSQYEHEQFRPGDTLFPNKPVRMGSATLSSRSERRRSRMAASVFEPSSPGLDLAHKGMVGDSIDSYRQKIESLKQDMGESWLKVYNQSEAA